VFETQEIISYCYPLRQKLGLYNHEISHQSQKLAKKTNLGPTLKLKT